MMIPQEAEPKKSARPVSFWKSHRGVPFCAKGLLALLPKCSSPCRALPALGKAVPTAWAYPPSWLPRSFERNFKVRCVPLRNAGDRERPTDE